ncbi:MAG: erythromycin esterase family protein [Myxococcaceae bacterium]|nr:erythromycin esterase family protein [Myxococcaceae bacterium]
MAEQTRKVLVDAICASAQPWAETADDLELFMERVGSARLVLLGEATHGTHEFYRTRALLTQRLVAERGFRAVVVEGDWPDAARVNAYILGLGDDPDASEALGHFRRFPLWMWRNDDVVELVEWLHDHNMTLKARESRAGFYGMDLYSLHRSMDAVVRYLEETDPESAAVARLRYACFERFPQDATAYGRFAARSESCREQVIQQLVAFQRRALTLARRRADVDADAHFEAEQNARIAVAAEEYYRTLWEGGASGWNLRDAHMVETLVHLERHLASRADGPVKMVVWAHNSHLGDARATELADAGEHNVGQLVRQRWGTECLLVGFTTHHGTVTATSEWDGDAERKRVRPALRDSYEALFHHTGMRSFLMDLRDLGEAAAGLSEPRLERAIGVIYRPESERRSHYFRATLPRQFDCVFQFDETHALSPLERTSQWEAGETPETFPSGF